MLAVRDLSVTFPTDGGVLRAVDHVCLEVHENEVLGIVGESGSGKTTIALALLGLLPARAVVDGEVTFRGRSLLGLSEHDWRELRGAKLALVSQEAMAALNPVVAVGKQVAEAIRAHSHGMSGRDVNQRAVELLDLVGIPDPQSRLGAYAHELSGGMRQRVVIAMAMANDPDVLIADEPTTALDVTVQAQVLDVIRRLHERTRSAIVLITHDLGVVAGLADRVAVMYAGRLVESGDTVTIFGRSAHPYTRGLLRSLPRLGGGPALPLTGIDGQQPSLADLPSGCAFHPRCPLALVPEPCGSEIPELRAAPTTGHATACHRAGEFGLAPTAVGAELGSTRRAFPLPRETVLDVRELVKHYPVRSGRLRQAASVVHAVCGVSFDVARGETLALVGESGCGKTTTARMILNLLPATSGSVRFRGRDVLGADGRALRAMRRHMQIVFQDPYASLNPRRSVGSIVAAPLRVHGATRAEARARVDELMALVGLDPGDVHRYPHEFSGGQRQRIGIARALALEPELVILDEPVSALDVSVRAGVINLLEDLQDRLGLAYVLIAHDLAVVRHAADRVAVMFLGKIVEIGDRHDIYLRPSHPYTQALLSAVPIPDPTRERKRTRILLVGDLSDAASPPSGCRFRTRCWKAEEVCSQQEPELVDRGQGHPVACHLAGPHP